jgi:hypothetical protein
LCLEALGDRLLPAPITFNPALSATHSLAASHIEELRSHLTSDYSLPSPNLVGAMGSTVNLGLGTLTIQTESWDPQTGSMKFTGTFVSSNKINPTGFPGADISDNIGAIPVTGHIQNPTVSISSNSVLNGIPVSYYTTGIDFHGAGDGSVGSGFNALPDHQQVSFSGSVLTWWVTNGTLPTQYAMGGSLDIKDTVQNIPVLGTRTFDTSAPVPGVTFAGMDWAPISFCTSTMPC